MGTQGESFMKKTQKSLSILAFETTKQSRILKKRMRSAALQKEVKADLRDLGNLVYNAVINNQAGILEEEEVKILVENIRDNKAEVEHLRDSMARLNRSRKHFEEEEFGLEAAAALEHPAPVSPPSSAAEPPVAPAEPVVAAPAPAAAEPLLEPEDDTESAKLRAKRTPRKQGAAKASDPAANDAGTSET